jgi:hypothetical protein
MVCKVVALGLILHPRAYLRRGWTLFEFTMVVLSWMQFIPASPNLTMMRLGRIVPAIQAISRLPGLRIFMSFSRMHCVHS